MEAQISNPESGIEDVYARRGRHYPTRSDSITDIQDRRDWITVACYIMTKGDKHPENISKIARSGSSRAEVIKSFKPKKPQRSLWDILIGIFNSSQRTKSPMPTVAELDALFDELNPPQPSSALEAYKRAHSAEEVSPQKTLSKKALLELPVISHFSRKTGGVLAKSEYQDNSMAVYYPHLTPKLQEVFRLFYGYRGVGDPSDPTSYNGHRDSIPMIATKLGLSYQTVYARFQKISQIIGGLRDQEEDNSETSEEIETVISTSQEKVETVLQSSTKSPNDPVEKPIITPEVQTPAFLRNRRIVTPIPKRQSDIVPQYKGETRPSSVTPSRVVRAPQPVPAKFAPPAQPKLTSVSNKNTPQKRGEEKFSFEELVAKSSDVRTIPKKPEIQPVPVLQKQVREIPEFTSYREALEWGQKQVDWMWSITLWRNSTPPIQRDNLAVMTYLRISRNTELQNFLDTIRVLSNPQPKYIKIFDALCTPLPAEKPSIADIQKNIGWMTLIKGAFQKHESGDHTGFMDSLATILADEALATRVCDLMPEYEAGDYMDILALIVEKNWTKKDTIPYQARTLREVIGYKPGKYVRLDAILEKGSHVGKKILTTGLSDIILRTPLGKTTWSRFQEKNLPEVSLYDVIVSLVQKNEGDVSSSKALFFELEKIIG